MFKDITQIWRSNIYILQILSYFRSNRINIVRNYYFFYFNKHRGWRQKPNMCVGETWIRDLVGSRHGACDLRNMLRFTESASFPFLFKKITSNKFLKNIYMWIRHVFVTRMRFSLTRFWLATLCLRVSLFSRSFNRGS